MQGFGLDEARVLRQAIDTSDPWTIAGQARIDFPRFVRTVRRLERRGFIKTSRGRIAITPKGKKATGDLGIRSPGVVARRIKAARREFQAITEQRPASTSLYNQGYMDINSVLRRVELMVRLGDGDSREVAILGDDDLVSIALCLSSQPSKVTVLEIDRRVVDFIGKIALARKLPITAECVDLRDPIPGRLRGRFDAFVSDPSETMAGLRKFIGRGLALLRPGEGRAGYFGLTAIEASYRKWARIQKWLTNSYALAITHILPGNAYYHNWPDLLAQTACYSMDCLSTRPRASWFNSSLVRLETLRGFKPKQPGRVRGTIFRDSEACGRTQEGVR